MNRIVSWFFRILLASIAKVAKALLIKEIKGWENIPRENFILVSNHQSHLDEFATAYLCVLRKYHFIGQTDSYKGVVKFLLYLLYYIADVIHLDRTSEESKREAMKQAIDVLKKGDILIIYPEGTRTRTGEMGRGKWGTARIFLATGKPILPVGIKGTFDLLPAGGKLKIKKIVKVNIGKPLYLKEEFEKGKVLDQNSKEYQDLLVTITEKMMERITSLKAEMN